MTENYYSNGKLILTGEYLVLDGAESLVLPLAMGQSMIVSTAYLAGQKNIKWTAKQNGKIWFYALIDSGQFIILETNSLPVCNRLIKLFEIIKKSDPEKFNTSLNFETNVRFDRNWGLGTSSTQLSNLAAWAGMDPFELHFRVSEGSGSDIAAAIFNEPLIYSLRDKKPVIENVEFNPSFHEDLYFAFLGRKQNSEIELHRYRKIIKPDKELIEKVSNLTREIVNGTSLPDFEHAMNEHEKLISNHIQRKPIGEIMFPDFEGSVKSLGAWGGDFILIATDKGDQYVRTYFQQRGLTTLFSYKDIVLRKRKEVLQ